MTPDKYSAIWLSHSSISDFLACPRAYYLKNIYKDRTSGNKIQIISPSLALGSAVHEVIETLSTISTDKRFAESPVLIFDRIWENYRGKQGGFRDAETEYQYKERGKAMLRRIMENPGPLSNYAVKIREQLPFFWLSEEENLILCGKIDWLEYLKDTDSLHLIDFKTGQKEETADSLQLPIYSLLVANCQKRPITKASYWYLEFSNIPKPKILPDLAEAQKMILDIGRKIKLSRKLEKLDCPHGKDGCFHCQPLEAVVRKEAEKVGQMGRKDIYLLESVNTLLPETDDSFVI